MPDNGFFTDLRKMMQLADNQVVGSLYIIYILSLCKSIIQRKRNLLFFFDDEAAARQTACKPCALVCGFSRCNPLILSAKFHSKQNTNVKTLITHTK